MSLPTVSIMMPAYNAEQFVARAIESVLAQRFTDWELMAVDDGSTDRTGEILEQYSGDGRIRIVHQPNRGEAAARNVALARMRGQFVAFLDADDEYLPEHLGATVGYLRSHHEYDGVYTDGYYASDTGERLRKLSERRRRPLTGRLFAEIVRGSNLVEPPLSVVLRREPIERAGLRFDERIVIGPDWDFFLKFADIGAFGYVDQQTCLYRVHDTNISRRVDLRKRRLERARCRTNAIEMSSFAACPLSVRVGVFHDLLIESLRDEPDRQREVLDWPAFLTLPKSERARLLRLMASTAILQGSEPAIAREWIRRSLRCDPRDPLCRVVGILLWLSPDLCRVALRLRRLNQPESMTPDPLGDLKIHQRAGALSQ